MERQLSAVVRGYVQGVGYRVFAAREAKALGLVGWVKNRSDGAVEVLAEGGEAALKQFLARLERGPSESEVSHVSVEWGAATGVFEEFYIQG